MQQIHPKTSALILSIALLLSGLHLDTGPRRCEANGGAGRSLCRERVGGRFFAGGPAGAGGGLLRAPFRSAQSFQ